MKLVRTLRALGLSLAIAAALVATSAAAAVGAPALKLSTLVPDHVTPGRLMYTLVSIQNVGTAER